MFTKINGLPFVFHQVQDDLFLKDLYAYCLSVEEEILKLPPTWETSALSPTSSRFGNYNFLGFSGKIVTRVREIIILACSEMKENLNLKVDEPVWIQCWVNIHRKGQFLQKHTHFPGFLMHGHLTVNAPDTFTVYGPKNEIVCRNQNGVVSVLGDSSVPHFTSPYMQEHGARVSIAFDIVTESVRKEKFKDRKFLPFEFAPIERQGPEILEMGR